MEIYRNFTKHTDFVVAYLSVARQHEHHTRVEVPKLKHAPVNLGRQLQDYLDDPDFEIHRRQYLAEQDGKKRFKSSKPGASSSSDFPDTALDFPEPAVNNPFPKSSSASSTAAPVAAKAPEPKPAAKGPEPDLIDFFESIEENQTVVNPQPSNSFQPPAQAPMQQPMFQPAFQQTGLQLQQPGFPQNGALQTQQTGFIQQTQQPQPQPLQPDFTGAGFGGFTPQNQSGFQPSSLGAIPQESIANFQSPPMSPPQQPPATGLMPMPTGQTTNPFRQSMMAAQQTGMQMPTPASPPVQGLQRQSTNPFARSPQNTPPFQNQQQPSQPPAPLQPTPTGTNPFARNIQQPTMTQTSQAGQQQSPTALAPQPTGSTNPFRQGAFVNHQTGMGWQHNQVPMGGGLDQLQTNPVFPRPTQQTPWQQGQQ